MPEITVALLRKRAEHNEGLVTSLEELTLHQEELESINVVLGRNCRQLKILYLQNNIISKMENLSQLRRLEYLNLALNNIARIEGLQNAEFLNKLDLTVNFIGLDVLRESMEHLQPLAHLADLYLMGNPCQSDWNDEAFRDYVVAKVPQLERLDGQEVTRSQRILAQQRLAGLELELETLAAAARKTKAREAEAKAKAAAAAAAAEAAEVDGELDVSAVAARDPVAAAEKLTAHTPEVRTAMYREMAEEKAEKQAREDSMKPRTRDFDSEHATAVEVARVREATQASEREDKLPRQTNQAGLEFVISEEGREGKGAVLLDLTLPRHLDSSLVDVDVHPKYVSVVLKSKRLVLHLPAEVVSGRATAQRSKVTGHLLITMPKENPDENMLSLRAAKRQEQRDADAEKRRQEQERRKRARNRSLAAQMVSANGGDDDDHDSSSESDDDEGDEDEGNGENLVPVAAQRPRAPVQLEGLVPRRFGGIGKTSGVAGDLRAVSTTKKQAAV